MPDLSAVIEEYVRGNDLDVIRTVTVVPAGQTLTDAYLRVNATSGGTQLFEKHITSTLVAGEGQIEDTGAGDGIAIIRFEITRTNGLTTTGGTVAAPSQHPYAIEVITSGGKNYEFEQGILEVVEEIIVQA